MPKSFPGRAPEDAENALRNAPIACHELDLEGNVVRINAAGCRLLGLTADQILGHPIWEFVSAGERETSRLAVARKLSEDLPLGVFERAYTRPDGSALVLEIHEQYRRGRRGQMVGIRSFLFDITARKLAEESLRKVQEELESRIRERTLDLELAIDFLRREMDERRLAEKEQRKLEAQLQYSQRLESMGVLAGGVAHKFNNLLTSIMGYAAMAGTELPEGSPARDHLEEVLSAAKSAAELTQQMLAYSGHGQFVLEALDVSQLAERTANLLESTISKKAELSLYLTPELPRIHADVDQIRQVLVNLATNASDALGDRSGEIAIRTGMMWAEGGELAALHSGHTMPAGLYVYLEVADTGSGMDAETLARIFDPFFTTKFTGRGLGLPAVMGIVRAHRGSIRVKSNTGQGTVIRVFFPALDDLEPPAAAARPYDSLAWPLTGTVLVVDDEDAVRRLVETVLDHAGLTVLTAADGDEALQIFRAHPQIHAVLLDLTMPGMDGAEVLKHILQLRPGVPVLLCSGYNELEVSGRLGEHRPAGFLRKPYHPDELLNLLSSVW